MIIDSYQYMYIPQLNDGPQPIIYSSSPCLGFSTTNDSEEKKKDQDGDRRRRKTKDQRRL